jgi:hypothetical protein
MSEHVVNGNPLEKIIARAMENASYRVNQWNNWEGAAGDTPIEKILSLAVVSEVYSLQTYFSTLRGLGYKKSKICHDEKIVGCWETPLFFGAQFYALDWPVDFIYTVKGDGTGPVLAVECDGHDFHERTKEQAAKDRSRDRRLQEAGYTVFRFTGSELWRDPCSCSDQIIKWATAQV